MRNQPRMVCIHRLQDPIEANLIRGLLMNEGIPAEVTGEGLVGAYSGVPKVCDVRVLVPSRFRETAETVVRRYEEGRHRGATETDWLCDKCGETNHPSFEICWRCGHVMSQ